MQQREIVLTQEGLEKLQEEIERLSTTEREKVAERIREAREFGDISENSEYDDAKNDQAMLEHRINQLQDKLRLARVIKESDIAKGKVSLGVTVTLKDVEYDETLVYQLVGSAEADPSNHKLSNESPVGQAILGKVVGDVVNVPAPVGSLKYEVLKIEVA
ncbi:MAG: transcription elongation factor GreA [Thermoleophilia bacterium]